MKILRQRFKVALNVTAFQLKGNVIDANSLCMNCELGDNLAGLTLFFRFHCLKFNLPSILHLIFFRQLNMFNFTFFLVLFSLIYMG
jgi:hypothetical protein